MTMHVNPDNCKLFALGVLDGEEKQAIQAHIRSCADCAANMASAHQMVSLVGIASVPALPRAAIKEKIMRRIRAESAETWAGRKPIPVADPQVEVEDETQSQLDAFEPQPAIADPHVEAESVSHAQPSALEPQTAIAELHAEGGDEKQAKPHRPGAQAEQRESPSGSKSNGRMPVIVAALALLALAGIAVTLLQQERAERRQAAGLQAQVEQLRHNLQAEHSRVEQKLLDARDGDGVLAAPGTVHIALTGATGHGGVLYNPHAGIVVCAIELPPPPAGRNYQLWAISWIGVPVNVGVMPRTEPAYIAAHVKPGAWESQFVITAEADAGAPKPTGPRMLAGGIDE